MLCCPVIIVAVTWVVVVVVGRRWCLFVFVVPLVQQGFAVVVVTALVNTFFSC